MVDLLAQLKDVRAKLGLLSVAKVTGGAHNTGSMIRVLVFSILITY